MPHRVLIACPNEEQKAAFSKVSALFKSDKFKLKATDYDAFLEQNHVATFDFAVIMVLQPIETDELEMQEEFYDHYMNAPISAIFSTAGEVELPESIKGKVSHKFFHSELGLQATCDTLATELEKLKGAYE